MDKNVRICIVGGGPAGLSAGMYLEKKGYENYTILERLDRVGGKCWSPTYNGRRYEMGAIMGVPSYYAVHDVEEFCGITHDGPQLNRNYKNKNGDVIEPFEPKKNILKIPRLLRMKKQVKKLGELLETKYKGYDVNGHRGVAEGRYDGFSQASAKREPVKGENPNLKDLCLPFKEFCKLNGIDLIQDIWIGPFTSFGYGYFDEIPAAYVLKYLDFQTCMNFVKINLWTWKNGTQITGQTVADGNKATKPADPTASGYTFKGWYTDSTFQTAFDFGTAIHADTTLYAKWVANSVSPTDPTTPQTGDNSNMLLWVMLLAVSGAALTGTAIYSRKRKHN